MNIFILDNDLDKSAEYHVDKHVVKMPLEAAQMLCANYWITLALGHVPRKITPLELVEVKQKVTSEFYGISHYNHPCTIWARSNQATYEYLTCYAHALNDEYGYRYGKSHKSIEVINRLPQGLLPPGPLLEPAQAMPDQYKRDSAVEAYRAYYIGEKSHLATWSHRGQPEWFN
jgi:hypothetical protein